MSASRQLNLLFVLCYMLMAQFAVPVAAPQQSTRIGEAAVPSDAPTAAPRFSPTQAAPTKIWGADFGPYVDGQNPNSVPAPQIGVPQIQARLAIIAPYIRWVRTFSMTNGLENIPSAARGFGLKVAAGAWIGGDTAHDTLEINNLIAAVNAGLVDIAIIGSEAVLRFDNQQPNGVSAAQIVAYMNQVRQAIPSGVPVTTADVYGTFLTHPDLIAASDVIFANFYPYWEGTSVDNAACSLAQEYQQLSAAAVSKQVWISETGWPSAGDAVGAAVPSQANENVYALQVLSWANANNIPILYFEAEDESWKSSTAEGPQGGHWGIFDSSGVIKTGMDAFFNGQTSTLACNNQLPGPVGITPVYVPPYGSSDPLEVQVAGVLPGSSVLAAYIKVGSGWWTKPTFAQPTVAVPSNGLARIPVVTGGSDQLASEIVVYLTASSVVPPQAGGGGLPSIPSAVATLHLYRTAASVSGAITDTLNHPIAGASISSPALGQAISGSAGKYSFYNVIASGDTTLSVAATNYLFFTSPANITIAGGNQVVDFTGTPLPAIPFVNLPIATTGAPYSAVLSGTGGQPPYGNFQTASGALPPGLSLNGATGRISGKPTSTAGSPYQFGVTMTDSTGRTSGPTSLSITVFLGLVTSTALSSSASPSVLGQTVTLTAQVSPAPPNGTVVFLDGVNQLAVVRVTNGTAALSAALLPAGVRSLRAYYGGDPTHLASSSTVLLQSVQTRPAAGFSGPSSYADTGQGEHIVVADFNRDGIPDLAATSGVLLGNGDGSFRSAGGYPTGTDASLFTGGDVNNDGIPDLITANWGTSSIDVLLGIGDGTFQGPTSYPAGPRPQGTIAAADLNNDGNLDVIVLNSENAEISVLLGNGNGTFNPPVSIPVGNYPYSVVAADFNRDGKTDLAVANSHDNNLTILMGNGDGTFQAAVNYAVGVFPVAVLADDFNGDGRLDLIVGNDRVNFGVLMGNADGTFQPAVTYPADIFGVGALATADFDGDGKLDILLGSGTSVGVALGNGDGTFQAPTNYFQSLYPIASLTVADLNGDGRTDIVLGALTSITANHFSTNVLLGLSSSLTVTLTHNGRVTAGQTAATYTATVSNDGAAVATLGAVTLTENIPTGLTLVSMAGPGWSCPGTAANNCTRSDVLAGGASYPAITVTVNVANNASTPQVNGVSVSGGGSATASTTDLTVINTVPVISFVNPASGQPGAVNLAFAITGSFTHFAQGTSTVSFSGSGITPGSVTVTDATHLWVPLTFAGNAPLGAQNVIVTTGAEVATLLNGFTVLGPTGLRFVPITPCRVVDTRKTSFGPIFGAPSISGGGSRDFAIPAGGCSIPNTAQAYSLNVAVVPPGPLGFLTLWPAGQTRPVASTLNSLDGRTKSSAAIVPTGTG